MNSGFLSGVFVLSLTSTLPGCASDPPPQPATVATPVTIANPPTAVAPSSPATAEPTTAPPAPSPPTISDSQPPAGMEWVDKKGDFRLATKKDSQDGVCEVWNLATQKKVAQVDGMGSVAGGADPVCAALSPMATLVHIGNGRGMVWKNWSNQITSCVGDVVAPDDSSCIEDDKSPFYFAGKTGPAVDLDVTWSTPKGASKTVATIPRGLNRDGGDSKWWTTQYCSPEKAVIDINKGATFIVVDTRTGTAHKTKRVPNQPACP
jgi:hypothetical protein